MRISLKNSKMFYYVRLTGYTDKVDINGYKTGEKIPTYSTPTEIRLSLYQTSGDLESSETGLVENYDYVAYTSEDVLEKNDLLFNVEPSSDFDTTYDYRIDKKVNNLNTNKYGLVKRK